jgi:hypothetical protein
MPYETLKDDSMRSASHDGSGRTSSYSRYLGRTAVPYTAVLSTVGVAARTRSSYYARPWADDEYGQ